MDKRNKTALAYLLIGVAAAGRCLLAVPENTALQEISLTVLALVGYLLLASRDKRPVLLGGAGLVLELLLCGGQTGGVWVWLSPALRALDLWIFWAAALLLLCLADCTSRRVPYVPLAVYTVTHFIPALATVAAVAFVAFSVLMLWFAAVMIKSYSAARVKK